MRSLPLPLCVSLLLPVSAFAEPLKTDTRPLTSFEGEAPAPFRYKSAETEVVTQGVTDGTKALLLRFKPGDMYPSINFPFPADAPADFSGYGGIAFDAFNPGEHNVTFAIRVDSDEKADGNGKHSRGGKGSLDSGQKATFVMPFGVDPSSLGMKSLPGFGDYRSLGLGGKGPFDFAHIVTWQLYTINPQDDLELIIDNVRLIPGQKQDFTGMIDKFGQYARQDWPGKIKSDAELVAQLSAEDKDLAAHVSVPRRNQYGGWADGPQLNATGFFRTEKYKGKWALVDPEGRLFISFGPTCVATGSNTIIKGREQLFSVLPKDDALLAKYTSKDGEKVDFLYANLERKYGADSKKIWNERTYTRLISWGFNSIGAFSGWEVFNNGRVPHCATLWPPDGHARLATGHEQVRAMHDPFDPKFAENVAAAARGQAERVKNDPFLIGTFVGNEEHLGHWRGGAKSRYTLVLTGLKLNAAESPAKRAFVAKLKEKHGDITKLNAAWGTKFADWAALDAPIKLDDPISEAVEADLSTLLTLFSEQYFRTVRDELKKADPNHLYLGCRFAGYSPEILEAAAKYTDVMSFNVYRLRIEPKEWEVLEPYDAPVMIGEFHFGATDRGMFDVGLIGVADQEARGRAYQEYVTSILTHPKMVGAHWFQYADQCPTGRPMDGENGNLGFVSITDTPYPELINAAREIHGKMYELRWP